MLRDFTGERLEPHILNENTVKHLHRYAIASQYIKDKIILDIASGEGYGSNLMSMKAAFVYGVDIDADTIKDAQQKYSKKNIKFIEGSTSSIPLETNSVDVVVSFETLEHHNEHDEMFKEIKRVLRKDGTLIISTPDKHYYSDMRSYNNPYHIKELYKNEFVDLVSEFFSEKQILDQRYLNGNSIITSSEYQLSLNYLGGDFLSVKTINPNPEFLIAIASENTFVKQNSSIFDGGDILQKNLFNTVRDVKNSATYRLGDTLLMPFKYLKAILKSSS